MLLYFWNLDPLLEHCAAETWKLLPTSEKEWISYKLTLSWTSKGLWRGSRFQRPTANYVFFYRGTLTEISLLIFLLLFPQTLMKNIFLALVSLSFSLRGSCLRLGSSTYVCYSISKGLVMRACSYQPAVFHQEIPTTAAQNPWLMIVRA